MDNTEKVDRLHDVPVEIFRTAVENTFNHIIITDADGFIIYANKSAERLTGFTFAEMKGKTPALWGRQMEPAFYIELWDTIKNKKQPFHGEIKNKRKNDEIYYAIATISPIFDENGELTAFLGLEEDITEQKNYTIKLEAEVKERTKDLDRRVRELTQLEQEKNNFISSASHQLRTPAGVIQMQLELLRSELEQMPDGHKVFQELDALEENNKRVIDIMNDLFKVVEFGDGYVASNVKAINLRDVFDSIYKSYEDAIVTKKVHYEVNVPSDLMISVDESRFKYAVLNLIDNAITYTSAEGTIKISATKIDGVIKIIVQDDGIGIPKEDQVFIFDKFFRASNSYLKKSVGTGLGLSITKIVTEGHGGKISFVSTEGEGTSFTLSFPELNLAK
ncbi:MAG: hypothetical protein RLZZ230_548 [Candidatus Parcubacteria bacterium]|jgi:PAS domain S-box-containing protein